jgi:two-component system nitrogen regulation response regulator GlnG
MRGDDIMVTAKYFINEIREKTEAGPSFMSPDVEQYLLSHDWPENVKELEKTIKKACLICKSDYLTKDDLSPEQPESIAEFLEKKLNSYMKNIKRIENFTLYETVISEVERALFFISLKETKGNQLRAAKLLGINRNPLNKKIDQLQIDVNEFKETPDPHSSS